jgi:hypothetical protein
MQHFHPELGYLLPTAQFRRSVRHALVAAAFGAMSGAIGVLALTHRHDPALAYSDAALAAGRVDVPTDARIQMPTATPAAVDAMASTAQPDQAATFSKKRHRIAHNREKTRIKDRKEADPRRAYAMPYPTREEGFRRDWGGNWNRSWNDSWSSR